MKVVQDLTAAGFLETARGQAGSLRPGRRAKEINLGALVRHTERDFALVDCPVCQIALACTLPHVLAGAVRAFLDILDLHTLVDLLEHRGVLRHLRLPPPSGS